jgi:hypothetical protein
MPSLRFRWLSVCVVLCPLAVLIGAAPVPLGEVAPLEDLVFEVAARVAELDRLLATAEAFDEAKDGEVPRAFGVLALMGQAIAEHADARGTQVSGPALRAAALQFGEESSYEDAQAALAAVKEAQSGKGGDVAAEHNWARLIRMGPMMEEVEDRSGKLVRVARRPGGKPEEIAHASTLAVLALAMAEDTHEVKNEADIPSWKEMSLQYQQQMTRMAVAIRTKDRKSAGELLIAATETCDRCHEKFRDE